MKEQIESIILENEDGRCLRIYKLHNSDAFCIVIEGADQRFEFNAIDAEKITASIDLVVDSFA